MIDGQPGSQTLISNNQDKTETRASFVLDREMRQLKWGNWQDQTGRRTHTASDAVLFTDLIKHGAHYRNDARGNASGVRSTQIAIADLNDTTHEDDSTSCDPIGLWTAGIDNARSSLSRIDSTISPLLSFDWKWESNTPSPATNLVATTADGESLQLALTTTKHPLIQTLEHKIGTRRDVWKFIYQEINAVQVPQVIQFESNDSSTGKVSYRTYKFIDSTVNRTVKRSEFALSEIGVHRDDLVRDQRAEVQYVYQGLQAKSKPGGSSIVEEVSLSVLIGANLAFWIVILVAVLLIQRNQWLKPDRDKTKS